MAEDVKTIGILFGRERSFPPVLAEAITQKAKGAVVASAVKVGAQPQDVRPPYDLILDRISQDVPFYRTYLKAAVAMGIQVINNPFWWSADDKFVGNVIARAAGVAVPKTFLLPHKEHPPQTSGESFSNLAYPVAWDEVFDTLGFPIFMKPAYGGGWRDVYKCGSATEFFEAYDQTKSLTMMAQEAIVFSEYYRCYVLGRSRVLVMRYDPTAPFEHRYVRDAAPTDPKLLSRIENDCMVLCGELGYDFNTVEFAIRDGIPYAIDFTNPAPDCDRFSVGDKNFEWVLGNAAELLIDRALHPRPFETTGSWPKRLPGLTGRAPSKAPARKGK